MLASFNIAVQSVSSNTLTNVKTDFSGGNLLAGVADAIKYVSDKFSGVSEKIVGDALRHMGDNSQYASQDIGTGEVAPKALPAAPVSDRGNSI